jgi:outer membrane protein OmpA-like peptidoglycan-associated protein/tetratricopeptide (TPR) repeat protein
MKLIFTIFLTLVIFFNFGYTQDTKSLKSNGDREFKLEHYRKALPFFEQIIQADPKDADAVFKAGVCYLYRYSKEKALESLLKANAMDPNVDKHMAYWLGRAYHQNYQFDKALENYNTYKSAYGKYDERRLEVEKYIRQTEFSKKMVANPKDFLVANLGSTINTMYSEHSPVSSYNDSMLLFTSRRNNSTGAGVEDLDGEYFEDIYQSAKGGDGNWSKPETIHLNTSGHDASVQLFDHDKKLLLYKFTHGGDIYYTEKNGSGWNEPQKFANINTPDFEADAFITEDGNTAYFVTNHYKKKGDLDIYYMTKDAQGVWSKPQDLKGNINTNEDEDGPFLTKDGKTLYFSSRGHDNMGGYDIFKSTRDSSGNWSEPINMGHPINTPDDDVYYFVESDGYRGYLSSYREGGFGEKDIYEIIPIPYLVIKGDVISENTGKKVDNVRLIFTPQRKTSKSLIDLNSADGSYQSKIQSYDTYHVSIIKGADTLHKDIYQVPLIKKEGEVISKNFVVPYHEVVKVDTTIAKVDTTTKVKATPVLVAQNIYFDVNKYDLRSDAKVELDNLVKLMKENPTVKVEILGFTDTDGDDKLNQILSDNRAKKAYKYISSKGIKNSRLSYKGMGESNVNPNDTPENKQKNRRDEFKITQ